MRVTENREYQQTKYIYKQITPLDEENALPDRWVSTLVAVEEKGERRKKNFRVIIIMCKESNKICITDVCDRLYHQNQQ